MLVRGKLIRLVKKKQNPVRKIISTTLLCRLYCVYAPEELVLGAGIVQGGSKSHPICRIGK